MEILESKTDIGLIRKVNEDVALAINHPKNQNIRLLIVADGMGGKQHGEIASNFVVTSLYKWFVEKDCNILNDSEKVLSLLQRYIKTLNTSLIKKYGKNKLGTTLTMALINSKNTIIINLGDSRTYTYTGKKLTQETDDDSDVWLYYKYGGVKKDDLRYFPNNNVINSCIGLSKELCKISSKIISNNYEMLLLLSDGVTDLITDSKIKHLIRKSNRKDLLQNIINEAVNIDQHLKVPQRLKRKYHAKYIVPFKGRDNASGSIFIKNV